MTTDKQTLADLALFGGPPAFEEPLHVGRPNVGDRKVLLARINDILDRRWFTNDGPVVREFERRIADYVGVRHCIATCNATVGLEIAARAVGFRGEVIVPSFTFVATAHSLEWQQITPVFCEIDPETHNIDPSRIEALITPRTSGILGVHVWGRGCDVEAIGEIGRRRNLRVMYDACHAFGATHRGRRIGGFGDAEVFSFHATKFLNSFEGGAIATNDDAVAERIRLMRNFGFAGYDRVIHPGTNGKMTEVCAAMGLTSLEEIDRLIAVNRHHYGRYRHHLAAVPGLKIISYPEGEEANFQYVIIEIDPATAGISRDMLVEVLHAERAIVRKYFFPGCHRHEPYAGRNQGPSAELPLTDRLASRVLSLPTGTGITEAEIERLTRLIRFCCERGREIAAARDRTRKNAGGGER